MVDGRHLRRLGALADSHHCCPDVTMPHDIELREAVLRSIDRTLWIDLGVHTRDSGVA